MMTPLLPSCIICEHVWMSIAYRRLDERDLDSFMGLRIRQLREEGATEDIDLRPALLDYYTRHMKDGSSVAWLAVDDGGKSSGQAACHSSRNRRISDVQVAGWACCPACTRILGTGVAASRRSCCAKSLTRPGHMAAAQCRSRFRHGREAL